MRNSRRIAASARGAKRGNTMLQVVVGGSLITIILMAWLRANQYVVRNITNQRIAGDRVDFLEERLAAMKNRIATGPGGPVGFIRQFCTTAPTDSTGPAYLMNPPLTSAPDDAFAAGFFPALTGPTESVEYRSGTTITVTYDIILQKQTYVSGTGFLLDVIPFDGSAKLSDVALIDIVAKFNDPLGGSVTAAREAVISVP